MLVTQFRGADPAKDQYFKLIFLFKNIEDIWHKNGKYHAEVYI